MGLPLEAYPGAMHLPTREKVQPLTGWTFSLRNVKERTLYQSGENRIGSQSISIRDNAFERFPFASLKTRSISLRTSGDCSARWQKKTSLRLRFVSTISGNSGPAVCLRGIWPAGRLAGRSSTRCSSSEGILSLRKASSSSLRRSGGAMWSSLLTASLLTSTRPLSQRETVA
jgi:hypothetical protein